MSSQKQRQNWIQAFLFTSELELPVQYVLRSLRLVHDWLHTAGYQSLPFVSCLDEILQCLFLLDRQKVVPENKNSTAFRVLMTCRDLAREFKLEEKLDDGIAALSQHLQYLQSLQHIEPTETCWVLHTLGLLLDQKKEHASAKEFQQQALAIQDTALPRDSLETIWSLNELGRISRHLEIYHEAESYHLDALHRLRNLGLSDSSLPVTWTLNTLARLHRKQGRLDDALELHARALSAQQQSLGPDHPHALWTMTDIGRCLRDRGRLDEALEYHQMALIGRKKVLGTKHLDTLWTLNDIGIILEEEGKLKEARDRHAKALEGQVERLGREHEHCVWSEAAICRLDGRLQMLEERKSDWDFSI